MPIHRDAVFSIIFIVIVTINISEGVPSTTSRPTVTNNDIRDAILQIVNVIRTTEDKLERHEYRERFLGDQLKKGLISIERRIKQWDHFKGAITRLDERLAAVETILIQKEERERLQAMKTFDAVDDIQKKLPLIMEELKKDILEELQKQKVNTTPPPPPPPSIPVKPEISKKDFEGLKNDIVKKIDKVNDSIGKIGKNIESVKVDKGICKELNEKTNSSLTKLDKQLKSEEDILRKYEEKLGQYKESLKEVPAKLKEQTDLQNNFLKSLKEQKQLIEEVQTGVKNVSKRLSTLPQNDDLEKIKNNTKDLVKEINQNTDNRSKTLIENIDTKIKDVKNKLSKDHEEIKKSVEQLANNTESLTPKINDVKSKLNKDHDEIKRSIEQLANNTESLTPKINDVKKQLNKDQEEIKKAIEQLANNTESLTPKINDVKNQLNKDHEELKKSVEQLTNNTESLDARFVKNYEGMKSDLQSIKKVDEVMVQTADNVLDTKRRLEYGVHQILGEMGQLMKTATKEIANTISDRFDVFELSVLDDENGALANLTHKIGDEIDQVWRQIGIMHQKMNANADILTKLQNQTDAYVNGSSSVMDGMTGKVAKITSKIVELDENLNYLMGRLMLVSHEFNQIKTGLSKALDEIKGTFHAVQDRIKDPGPGPHQIDSYEVPNINPARK